jgi:hypothetical protein
MDIGKETETVVVEPIEDPVKRVREGEPDPVHETTQTELEPETVPA